MPNDSLADLTAQVRAFADARDWQQFHSPKNLAAAMTVEAGEVLEHFQWLTEAESETLSAQKRSEVELELADVLIYLVRLADRLGVDLIAAAARKIAINAQKYPVERAKGSNQKYTERQP
jgi:dCTP diphosphatase